MLYPHRTTFLRISSLFQGHEICHLCRVSIFAQGANADRLQCAADQPPKVHRSQATDTGRNFTGLRGYPLPRFYGCANRHQCERGTEDPLQGKGWRPLVLTPLIIPCGDGGPSLRTHTAPNHRKTLTFKNQTSCKQYLSKSKAETS